MMSGVNVAVIVKLEPDFSEGNVSYNPDGTLNRAETKNILGPHSAIAVNAAFYAKVRYGAKIAICTMGPPVAESMLQSALLLSNADNLYLYSDRIFAGADTLATAEVLKSGILNMGETTDVVFSGHRASDGETGQTGPQTAWKLGMTFLGNVIDYEIDTIARKVRAKRLVRLEGIYDVVEEIEAPLPVFIAIDPSYKPRFNTVSQRLAYEKHLQEAALRANDFRQYLKVLNASQISADPKQIGIAGSPTIVYKVERIPKAKATRQAQVVDGGDVDQIRQVVAKITQSLSTLVIK